MPYDGRLTNGADLSRLLRLARFARRMVNDVQFRFEPTAWLTQNPQPCGCLIGYALSRGAFSAEGFSLDSDGLPRYGDLTSHRAVAAFFDISEDEATQLFYYDICGQSPEQAITHLETLCAAAS